jgi:4-diphosphocytidyl-2-C-methyl-D-erythritol kinase
MSVLAETAFAKINLALHVRSRRPDGYHELDTVFAFVDDGDFLTCEPADTLSLSVMGPFGGILGSAEDNLVMRTAQAFAAKFNVTAGARITLEKRLPVASGIGGGSADAAATARLLNRLWGLQASDQALADILEPLGADIPACVVSNTVRGQGTGTQLSPLHDDFCGTPVLLVNPNTALSTAAVFAQWNGVDHGGMALSGGLDSIMKGRNDLQEPAIGLCPAIADVLTSLDQQVPVLARMSGSGATCFGLFKDHSHRNAAMRAIADDHADWWIMAGCLR